MDDQLVIFILLAALLLVLGEEGEGGKAQVGINMCKKTIHTNAVNKKPVEEKIISKLVISIYFQ